MGSLNNAEKFDERAIPEIQVHFPFPFEYEEKSGILVSAWDLPTEDPDKKFRRGLVFYHTDRESLKYVGKTLAKSSLPLLTTVGNALINIRTQLMFVAPIRILPGAELEVGACVLFPDVDGKLLNAGIDRRNAFLDLSFKRDDLIVCGELAAENDNLEAQSGIWNSNSTLVQRVVAGLKQMVYIK